MGRSRGEERRRLELNDVQVKYLLREAYEVQERYGGECGQTQREQRAIVVRWQQRKRISGMTSQQVSAIHRFCEQYREIMQGNAKNR